MGDRWEWMGFIGSSSFSVMSVALFLDWLLSAVFSCADHEQSWGNHVVKKLANFLAFFGGNKSYH